MGGFRLGTFTPSVLLEVARRDGRLARAGLEVTEVAVTSSPQQFASLAAGEYEAVFTSPDNVLAYHFLSHNPLGQRRALEVVAALDGGLGLALALTPGASDVTALAHGPLGVDVATSGFAFVAYALLECRGQAPGDYEVVALGSTPARAAALLAGGCAATIVNAGNDQRVASAGATLVATVAELGPYLGGVLAAEAGGRRDARAARERLADALVATAAEVRAGARERDVVEVAEDLLGLSAAEAHAHYRVLCDPRHGYVPDGRVDPAALHTLIDLRRRYLPDPELAGLEERVGEVVLARAQ